MKKSILFVFAALLGHCLAQTPVSLTPLPGPFLYTNGPNTGGALAFGCVYTFAVNSTTPLATYTDSSGLTMNPNPVILNNGGYAQLWFATGAVYSIKVVSSGGTNCSSGQTQYTVNGINQSLLNLSNTWQQTQYFLNPIYLEPADLQIVFGVSSGNQTTLDIPPTSANYILHGPPLTGNDTLLSANATQVVENKNLTSGTEINGCGVVNGPGTYVCIANNSITATVIDELAIFTGAPSTATIAPSGTASGVQGLVVAGAGITGTATLQQSGQGTCVFDSSTVAGDYIVPSPTVSGYCHDSGATPANGLQIIGQVLSTNASGGSYLINLFPPGLVAPTNTALTLPNDAATGTLQNGLVKQTANLSGATTAIRTASSDTAGAIGIAISNAGTSGNVTIQQQGFASCVFDAATTVNDYVVISSTPGECHDSGSAIAGPAGAQAIGQVLSTNATSGTYTIDLFGPSLPSAAYAPQRTVLSSPFGISANTQTIITPLTQTVTFPSAPGTYRADSRYGMWVTAGANVCAALVVDTTNNLTYGFSGQDANGSGYIGLSGGEVSSHLYSAGATATFTLQVACNAGTTVTVNSGIFGLSPAPVTYLAVTPVLSN